MNLLPESALDRLQEGCKIIGDRCSAMDISSWEVVATQSYGHQIDIEGGKISLAAGGGEGGFGIRVLEEGRFGFAYLVDVNSADTAIKSALSIARMSPAVNGFVLPSEQSAQPVSGLYDSSVVDMSSEDLLIQADDIISEVASLDDRAVVTGGGIGVSANASAIYSSEGVNAAGVTTSHGVGVQVSIEQSDQLTSSWQSTSSRSRISQANECVNRAVEWAKLTRNPIKVETPDDDSVVMMTSEGFSPLFSVVVPNAIRGEKLVREESFWSGHMGQNVIASDLSITDNARIPGGRSSGARDDEGVPTRENPLIDKGRLVASLWSTRDAAQQIAEGRIDAAKSTGSAIRSGHQSPPISGCSNLFLTSSQKGQSYEQMLELIEDGYIVNSVMGAHTANPTSGDFSVTTSSILRVEDGEIIGAVKQAGLSGNLAKAMKDGVLLGKEVRQQGSYSSGSMYLPNVLFKQGLRVNPV
ncbi:MAG TPA: TldD/PmbA family protein [Candidatus Poseidoniales archaeon]|nr:MAG TPA: TldD/PmbA family protein [Candidatus Poseidoniales archaeon]|tara:strand:+ start:1651 stop:3060 length:1410 start_codon:yes stop_codon:yes gene_type:complete